MEILSESLEPVVEVLVLKLFVKRFLGNDFSSTCQVCLFCPC